MGAEYTFEGIRSTFVMCHAAEMRSTAMYQKHHAAVITAVGSLVVVEKAGAAFCVARHMIVGADAGPPPAAKRIENTHAQGHWPELAVVLAAPNAAPPAPQPASSGAPQTDADAAARAAAVKRRLSRSCAEVARRAYDQRAAGPRVGEGGEGPSRGRLAGSFAESPADSWAGLMADSPAESRADSLRAPERCDRLSAAVRGGDFGAFAAVVIADAADVREICEQAAPPAD
eukprot:gene15112-17621_t